MQLAVWQRVLASVLRFVRSGDRWTKLGLVGVLSVYLSLGTMYAYGVPHLVSYDEPSHLSYVVSVWRGELPEFSTPMPLKDIGIRRHHSPQIWVAIHPPLYYALLAPAVGPAVDRGEPQVALRRGRLVSLAISGLGLVFIFLTFRLLLPHRPALAVGGTLFGSVIPFFLNVMGAVFNDSAGLLMSSALLYTSLVILIRGPTTPRVAHAAIWFGLAGMTRLSTLFTMGPALLAVFLAFMLQEKGWLRKIGHASLACAALVAAPVATSGWWYLRNVRLYDDFTGAKPALVLFKRTAGKPWHEYMLDPDKWKDVYEQLWSLFLAGYRLGPSVQDLGKWLLFAALGGLAFAVLRAAVPQVMQVRAIPARLRTLTRAQWSRALAFGIVALAVAFSAYSLMELHSRGGTCNARYMFTSAWVLGLAFAAGFSGWHRRWGLIGAACAFVLLNFDCASRILGRYAKQSEKSQDFGTVDAFLKAGVDSPTELYAAIVVGCAVGLGLVVVSIARLEPAGERLDSDRVA